MLFQKKKIIDFNFLISIINNFEFFNDCLKLIKKRVIKIEKNKFYLNKCVRDLT